MEKDKISLETVKQFPVQTLMRLINKAKEYIKKDKVWKKICDKYGESVEIIDIIPTRFDDLQVSAKCDHGIVLLNYKLLCDGDFFKDFSYLIHEYSHWFQQTTGDHPTQSSNDGDYLDNKYERESFTNQVEYIAEQFGDGEAENYVDNLLDHHDIDDKSKRDELESIFLEKV